MKKLYRYITKSFLGTFVLTFFIVVFIWVMQFMWTTWSAKDWNSRL